MSIFVIHKKPWHFIDKLDYLFIISLYKYFYYLIRNDERRNFTT